MYIELISARARRGIFKCGEYHAPLMLPARIQLRHRFVRESKELSTKAAPRPALYMLDVCAPTLVQLVLRACQTSCWD